MLTPYKRAKDDELFISSIDVAGHSIYAAVNHRELVLPQVEDALQISNSGHNADCTWHLMCKGHNLNKDVVGGQYEI